MQKTQDVVGLRDQHTIFRCKVTGNKPRTFVSYDIGICRQVAVLTNADLSDSGRVWRSDRFFWHDRRMCGRFSLTLPVDAMGRLFGFEPDTTVELAPRYNIAPSQLIAVVRRRGETSTRELSLLRWGFIPSWARDPASLRQPINARGETVSAKPMFREAFRHRRCLIPADGFYEWKRVSGGKQPWRIQRADGAPFAFAGVWDRWAGRDGKAIESCAILTTEANDIVRPIHDRMPVILDIGRFGPWLEASSVEAADLIEPYRGALSLFPVRRRINDPAQDDAELVVPLPDDEARPTSPILPEDPEPSLF
ncbi:MAG: SOS response-associated peptidase [Rhodospirillales bacterium]|nr:MAG: SOS response-associated peptidase [Rhodospirillales bacterium]